MSRPSHTNHPVRAIIQKGARESTCPQIHTQMTDTPSWAATPAAFSSHSSPDLSLERMISTTPPPAPPGRSARDCHCRQPLHLLLGSMPAVRRLLCSRPAAPPPSSHAALAPAPPSQTARCAWRPHRAPRSPPGHCIGSLQTRGAAAAPAVPPPGRLSGRGLPQPHGWRQQPAAPPAPAGSSSKQGGRGGGECSSGKQGGRTCKGQLCQAAVWEQPAAKRRAGRAPHGIADNRHSATRSQPWHGI